MPEPLDPTERLASRLLEGVAALRAQRPVDAIEPLLEVAEAPDLRAADDLQDIRARACTLLVQALLDAGRPQEAKRWLDEAHALAQAQEDAEGLAEITGLRKRRDSLLADALRRSSAAKRLQQLAETPIEAIRAQYEGQPVTLAEALIRKANAEVEAGRARSAEEAAQEALALAQATWSTRTEVMARLSLARAAPDRAREELTAAWRLAEREDAFTLVGAVARAAEAAGVDLPETVAPIADKDPS